MGRALYPSTFQNSWDVTSNYEVLVPVYTNLFPQKSSRILEYMTFSIVESTLQWQRLSQIEMTIK